MDDCNQDWGLEKCGHSWGTEVVCKLTCLCLNKLTRSWHDFPPTVVVKWMDYLMPISPHTHSVITCFLPLERPLIWALSLLRHTNNADTLWTLCNWTSACFKAATPCPWCNTIPMLLCVCARAWGEGVGSLLLIRSSSFSEWSVSERFNFDSLVWS